MSDHDKPKIISESLSQNRRLTAQGANFVPFVDKRDHNNKDWFCSQPGCDKLHSEHTSDAKLTDEQLDELERQLKLTYSPATDSGYRDLMRTLQSFLVNGPALIAELRTLRSADQSAGEIRRAQDEALAKMTKAERLSNEALAAIRETYEEGNALEMLAEDPSVFGGVLSHIAALEAQLAQRDKRIRVMHAAIRTNVRPKALAEWLIETDTVDAKEGEGK